MQELAGGTANKPPMGERASVQPAKLACAAMTAQPPLMADGGNTMLYTCIIRPVNTDPNQTATAPTYINGEADTVRAMLKKAATVDMHAAKTLEAQTAKATARAAYDRVLQSGNSEQIEAARAALDEAIETEREAKAAADIRVLVTPSDNQIFDAAAMVARSSINTMVRYRSDALALRLDKGRKCRNEAINDIDVLDIIQESALGMIAARNADFDSIPAAYDAGYRAVNAYLDSMRGNNARTVRAISDLTKADRDAIRDAIANVNNPAAEQVEDKTAAALAKLLPLLSDVQTDIVRYLACDWNITAVMQKLNIKSRKTMYKHIANIRKIASGIDADYAALLTDKTAANEALEAARAATLEAAEVHAKAARRAALTVDPAAVIPSATCGKRSPEERLTHALYVLDICRAVYAAADDEEKHTPAAVKAHAAAVLAKDAHEAARRAEHAAALTAYTAATAADKRLTLDATAARHDDARAALDRAITRAAIEQTAAARRALDRASEKEAAARAALEAARAAYDGDRDRAAVLTAIEDELADYRLTYVSKRTKEAEARRRAADDAAAIKAGRAVTLKQLDEQHNARLNLIRKHNKADRIARAAANEARRSNPAFEVARAALLESVRIADEARADRAELDAILADYAADYAAEVAEANAARAALDEARAASAVLALDSIKAGLYEAAARAADEARAALREFDTLDMEYREAARRAALDYSATVKKYGARSEQAKNALMRRRLMCDASAAVHARATRAARLTEAAADYAAEVEAAATVPAAIKSADRAKHAAATVKRL